jgi:hypothetical protein
MNLASNDTTAADTTASDTVAGDTMAGDAVASDSLAGDAVADDTTAEDAVADDAVANHTTVSDPTAEGATAGDTTAGDTTASDTTAEDTTAEGAGARERPSLRPAWPAVVLGALVLLFMLNVEAGSVVTLGAFALHQARRRAWWLAACAAAWIVVFLAVLFIPGPYDSWAGRAAIPVLTGYALCCLTGWALGRRIAGRRISRRRPAPAGTGRPELTWPTERRLRAYLAALLFIAVVASVIRYRGTRPPLFAADPDAARAALGARATVLVGLLSEAWTLGMVVSVLRALTGGRTGRWLYAGSACLFVCGAALGASKNSVLVGVVPAVIAALSVRHGRRRGWFSMRTRVVVLVGLVAVGAAVYLGGQRTLAGTGAFEDQFRARYGGNPVAASVGSLDLSLSSSAETFGHLWAQRDDLRPRYGAYSLEFLGSGEHAVYGTVDLYAITGQLSSPYYMNTATFVAVPLLDWGPAGAAVFLLLVGVCVGIGERRLEFSPGPAQQLGRGLIVYFAAFGIYELYPAMYATWLALVPGLWVLHRLGRVDR